MRKGSIILVIVLFARLAGFGQTESEYFKSASDKFQKQDYAGALTDFSKVIELNDKNTEAYFNRSVVKMNLKDNKGAITDLDTVLHRDSKREKAWANRAGMKAEIKDVDGAIADFDKVIELNSKNTEAYFNRGLLKKSKKDVKGSIQDLDTVVKRDPKNEKAWFTKGLLKFDSKDYTGAVKDLTEYLKLKEDPKTYYVRAFANNELKNTKAAIDDYTKAGQLDTLYADAFFAKAQLERKNKDKNAVISYSKVISLTEKEKDKNPKYFQSLLFRGMSKADQFNFRGAIEDYSKALELKPEDKNTLNQRAFAYQKLNMKNEACQDLEALVKLGDKNAIQSKAAYCK